MPPLHCTPPPALRPGDLVTVLAPSGPPPASSLRDGLAILSRRYRLRLDPTLGQRRGYLAGPDEARAAALNGAMRDPDVRAIFCARGGYGATRLLPFLDPAPLRADPKPIVGLSDITAILCWALAQGIGSVHGPVVTQLGALPPEDIAHLYQVLEQPEKGGVLAGRPLLGGSEGADTRVSGPLVGGNLSLLAALAGTPWALHTEAAILLIEDVSEAPYRLDRMLTQLGQQVGPARLDPAAVGVGQLVGCQPDRPDSADRAGDRHTALGALVDGLRAAGRPILSGLPSRSGIPNLSGLPSRSGIPNLSGLQNQPGLPILSGLPFGHGSRNKAWPVGTIACLDPRKGELRWGAG